VVPELINMRTFPNFLPSQTSIPTEVGVSLIESGSFELLSEVSYPHDETNCRFLAVDGRQNPIRGIDLEVERASIF